MIDTRVEGTTTAKELARADLGDRRRTERLCAISEIIERDPGKSFPKAFASDAALEAFYRFINNTGFQAGDIVAPHRDATIARAVKARTVLAIHDTTNVDFGAARVDPNDDSDAPPSSHSGTKRRE